MKKKTVREVAEIINIEGLGYAIGSFLESGRIDNKELSELWDKAASALEAVQDFLTKELGPDWYDFGD